MDKEERYNIESDPDFDANFYKNIEKVLSDAYIEDSKDGTVDTGLPSINRSTVEGGLPADNQAKEDEIPIINQDMPEGELPVVDQFGVAEELLATKEMLKDELVQTVLEESTAEGVTVISNMDTEEEINHRVDDALYDINSSLAKQISEELSLLDPAPRKKKKMSRGRKALNITLIVLACLVGLGSFLGFTDPGNRFLMRMGFDIGGKIWATMTKDFEKEPVIIENTDHLDEEDVDTDAEEIDPDTIIWPEHPGYGRQEEGVYNILLLGEEAIESGSARGRTDVIIIATMNTNTKELKLTSLMRDTLVRIPGYQENKLNTAYEKGGLDLLYETIAVNYDIRLDGCVMVNFDNFEKIVDKLGGIEITLTASEAKYLNRTNYISKPMYRTVVEGKQLMNGNQVLGYTRIRKRANINGANNDYGRTERHRIVLDAIFEKYKTKSKLELGSIMFGFLPMITTDISSNSFEMLLNKFFEMGTTKIDQLRLPADGTFTDNVEVRGMDVLIPDWDENITLLHDFVFGDSTAAAQ